MTTLRHILIAMLMVSAISLNAAEDMPVDSAGVADTATVASVMVKTKKMIKRPHDDLYQLPYSMWTRRENWVRLAENTGVLFAAGFATLGVLDLLPEDATAWNRKNIDGKPMFKRWWANFHAGPVWDSDQPLFNYILHPYAGAAYYMGARSQGFNVLGSLAYCAFISTVFWELGIECFNEVPSIQDLIITPIGGMVLGEAFYLLKRHIVSHDYRLWGSPVLGNAVAFIIDPVNEVLGLVFCNSARQWIKYNKQQSAINITSSWIPPSRDMKLGLTINATF